MRLQPMLRSPVLWLIALWAVLYIPYVAGGGFVRDDLGYLMQQRGGERYIGWLDTPRVFPDYWSFQSFVFETGRMANRPVAATVTALSYWVLGSGAWPFHALNLSLFLGSVLLVHGAVRQVVSESAAFITAAFALVFPSAAATLFSANIVISNLAGFFWAAALYVDARTPERGGHRWWVASAGLLALSALSYEAFIPLFLVNIVLRLAVPRARGRWRVPAAFGPFVAALLIGAAYRLVERGLFPGAYSVTSPIESPAPIATLVFRFMQAVALGIREYLIRPELIALGSIRELAGLSALAAVTLVVVVTGFTGYLTRQLASAMRIPPFEGASLLRRVAAAGRSREFHLLALAVAVYLAAHLIFVLSSLIPNAVGFDSRTGGGFRFAIAFLIAASVAWVARAVDNGRLRQLVVGATAATFLVFTVGVIGQREAWMGAARFNAHLVSGMTAAIRRANLDGLQSFTLVAILPSTFPGQVNGEPILGEAWDIGGALSQVYPDKNIRANVYEPHGTVVKLDRAVFHGYWEAAFPFYVYVFATGQIVRVATADELEHILPARPVE